MPQVAELIGYNSDDNELSEDESTTPSYFENEGKRSIAQLIKFAVEDRQQSKKVLKKLHDANGAPGSLRRRQFWFNIYSAWATDVMGLK